MIIIQKIQINPTISNVIVIIYLITLIIIIKKIKMQKLGIIIQVKLKKI